MTTRSQHPFPFSKQQTLFVFGLMVALAEKAENQVSRCGSKVFLKQKNPQQLMNATANCEHLHLHTIDLVQKCDLCKVIF